MDPVTVTIVSALAAGAAAGASDVTTSAIKDAYAGLKRLIVKRYAEAGAPADLVEKDPASKARQVVLAEELEKAGAFRDESLKKAAEALLDAVEASAPAAMVEIERLRAAKNFELEDIDATGPLFRGKQADFNGKVTAKRVRYKPSRGNTPKK